MKQLRWFLLIVVVALLVGSLTYLITAGWSDTEAEAGSVIVNSIGMKLAYVPAGTFEMGSPSDEKGRQDDEFRHRVKLTRPFRIGVTEVTQAQWRAVMGSVHCYFKGDNLPVEKVSWRDAATFCKKLSEKEGKTYQLPTEAEWEYACRAGTIRPFAGTSSIDQMGWYEANSEGRTHTVATKKPNALGLYDMHGNVSEWCSDVYSPDYAEVEVTDPVGATEGKYRVVRGGSWSHFARSARCAARSSAPASYQLKQTGFRVVMEVSR